MLSLGYAQTSRRDWLRKGELTRALADFNQAVALNPHEGFLLCSRGLAYLRLNQLEEAAKDFARCRELGGTLMPEVEQELQAVRKRQQPEQ
ncbi:MAG TPA: hypothetical protein VFZ34_18635 [Blastocatellia bacterium]|nr:hypothetical protein [Blastocatellia bacterium]